MIYRLEFGDRFTPACCLPVCTQMALNNELFLTVTIQTMLFLLPLGLSVAHLLAEPLLTPVNHPGVAFYGPYERLDTLHSTN